MSMDAYAGAEYALIDAYRNVTNGLDNCFKPYYTSDWNTCQQSCPVGVVTSDTLGGCVGYSKVTGYKCQCHHDSTGPAKRVQLSLKQRKLVQSEAARIMKANKISM